MKVQKKNFRDLSTKEGIVLLGTGGDPQGWITGISKMLYEKCITMTADPERLWQDATVLETSDGRLDLALFFKDISFFDMDKLAMFRFRDCPWVSDYRVNYADQHIIY